MMTVVTKIMNFTQAWGINHCQVRTLLEEENAEYEELPFHALVHWLSMVKVLRRFYEDIASFMTMKGKAFPATKV